MSRYFDKLPIIYYNGHYARNLLVRAKLSQETSDNITLFYEYQLKDHEYRTDIVAAKYYDDPDLTWLVNMSNDVIDSHYDLGLSADDLDKFITKKYGSIDIAREKIIHYKNDWESDDSLISTAAFDALSIAFKKYYTAVLTYSSQVMGYQRKQEDWIVATNKIITIPLADHDPIVGEKIVVGENEGTVVSSNSTAIIMKHITGSFANQTILSTSVAADEAAFWRAVTAHDVETEKNQEKRNIRLIDNRYVQTVEEELENTI